MTHQPSYSFFPLGDAAVLIDYGNVMDKAVHQKVLAAFHQLQQQKLSFITNLVPAYASLTVHYNIAEVRAYAKEGQTCFNAVAERLEQLLCRHTNTNEVNRLVRIPVCYEPFFAPDIEALANQKSITLHQLITLHTSVTYKVFMIGFLPGFPYMGEVDSSLEASRHLQPRKAVAAGSVGIAGKQTGIYPLTSPGGWQIIGRTPLRLFDVNRENAVLLQPGDSVQFYSITANEFAHNQSRSA